MADKQLFVYIDGRRAGIVSQANQGNTTFADDEEYRHGANPIPLSLSMPLTRQKHPSRAVVPFLQGLLPDNEARLARPAAENQTSLDGSAQERHESR